MRRIGVVTSGRCDYGIYLSILKRIAEHRDLELLLYVTGMHLLPEFGNTLKAIEADGFKVSEQVDMESYSDSAYGIAQAMGVCTAGFGRVFSDNSPDMLVVLGDRFEMHAAAVAAVPFNIPIAHIHGGEITQGAFDEQFRHSITKLSHLHFAATKEYAQRIIQMGEEPWRVIVSGAPALDNILSLSRYTKDELEDKFQISFSKPVFLITFHPVTMEPENTHSYISNLLKALSFYSDYNIVFTAPNADTGNSIISEEIKACVENNSSAFLVSNFGHQAYLSMMDKARVMIGNSSSGIIEAASFKLPVVNIGSRQAGRIRAANVIDTGYKVSEVKQGIDQAISDQFLASLDNLENPYGQGQASERIVSSLASIDLKKLNNKRFSDQTSIIGKRLGKRQ